MTEHDMDWYRCECKQCGSSESAIARGDVSASCNPPTAADEAAFRDMVAVVADTQRIINDAYVMTGQPPQLASKDATAAYEALNERMRSKVPWVSVPDAPGGGGVRVESALSENNELTLLKRKRDDERARAKKSELFSAEPLSRTVEQIAATWDVWRWGYGHL